MFHTKDNTKTVTLHEGEALRFTLDESGYCERYYEVNEEGLAVVKWQNDSVAQREWGTKPNFNKNFVYFFDEFMGGQFTYGKMTPDGGTELGKFHRSRRGFLVLPIEGEKRTDAI
ncbi:hypothetical protein [Paenibacillus sp. 1001270B_150601_E10]|uniref:hypothetical protein n=1 Tax=Paenibacillus sp. 1001270B_150601_E10 TaxID=2787079 RepID=UPI00189E6C0C|nr:hypothetical protein [Paenibacillus sp. 1001270B_150601_E10]